MPDTGLEKKREILKENHVLSLKPDDSWTGFLKMVQPLYYNYDAATSLEIRDKVKKILDLPNNKKVTTI